MTRAGLAVAAGLASLGAAMAAVHVPAGAACLSATPQPGPGSPAPFRPPATRATELNAAGTALYRQEKWEEARAQYRAAGAADPEFLAPRLNVACSYVRQERFGEATAEVVGLIERAYVPWAREVLEAADLGALKVRPEMAKIRSAIAAAATRWGEGLDESLLFVARQRPALRVPEHGAGIFILNPHQEVWAFSPATGRYRQLTAEEGHVVAMARSLDGRSVVYATAEKLVRGPTATDVALRGVVVRELALASMAVGPPARIDGDVRRLEIRQARAATGFVARIEGQRTNGVFGLESGTLRPVSEALDVTRGGPPLTVLTGRGAAPARPQRFGGASCPLVASEQAGGAGTPVVLVAPPGRKGTPLESGAGAGLAGLPIP